MTFEVPEEMLSAYLDGELSAEDRARVETWLAENAEARHLLDELRSVRSGMKSLPRKQLADNLAPSVLRRAERAVPEDLRQARIAGEVTPSTLARDWWSRGGWRRLVWPVAAIAAALVIALFDTERKPEERQVAQTHAPQGEIFIGAREQEEAPAAVADAKSRDTYPAGSARGASVDSGPAGEVRSKLARSQNEHAAQPAIPAAKMAGGAPAAAPAAEEFGKAGTPAVELKQSAADSADETLVVIDVTPAFARDRGFEKLLTSNKIAYRRGEQRQQIKADANVADKTDNLVFKKPDEEPYEVDATPEQVDQIITLLRQDVSRVGRIAKDQSLAQNRAQQQQRPASETPAPPAENQAQARANQRPPTQFLLRVVDSVPAQKARN